METGEEMAGKSEVLHLPHVEQRTSKRRLLAALASAIIPGLGQWLIGARRKAVAYFGCLLLIGMLYWPVRMPKEYWGLIVLVWLSLALFVFATWDAVRSRNSDLSPQSRWWLVVFLPVALLGLALYTNFSFRLSGFRNYSLPSSSMETTIRKGDWFVADMFAYRHSGPRPFEVVVFRRDKTPFVKRVIAGPGSMIEGKAGEVLVDGKHLSEPYAQHTGDPLPVLVNFGPTLIPAGKLFVMGDNRDVSYDSRISEFGLVDVVDVVGKPLYIYRSVNGWIRTDIH
jgi:signal peptidase I